MTVPWLRFSLHGDDVDDPGARSCSNGTFGAILTMGCIPIVNEKRLGIHRRNRDGQCGKVLGDNDTLSAIVARLCHADLLILLSDIDGLYDSDPRKNPGAKLIRHVAAITPELRAMAGGAGTWRGTGGMTTKLDAAEIALAAGVCMVITTGRA